MAQVMPLRDARARAERVYYLRAVAGLSWSAIRDECGYSSIGGTQNAYKRHVQRNPVPDGDTVLAEIMERKRVATGVASKALARAVAAGDWSAASSLLRTINAQDNELAKLYGLHAPERQQVDVTVGRSRADVLAEEESRFLASLADRRADPALPEPRRGLDARNTNGHSGSTATEGVDMEAIDAEVIE